MTTEDLQLSRLQPSPVHLRRGKDKLRDAELLDSVKRHGVLQPILVRPLLDEMTPGSAEVVAYQIVAGHRRYQAAKGAKLETIPALVKAMGDAEALELQVVENQQRSDVHPLEEAEGYRLLTEKHGYTVEQIAAKVGKSRAYVYGRMKLGALGKAGRTAFLDGKLDAAMALLVARIPESLQEKALEEIVHGGAYIGDGNRRAGMTYREAVRHVQRDYMLTLTEAPFDPADVKLLPAAGTCGACPKRTGNERDLFGDVHGKDICTDPICFRAKAAAAAKSLRVKLEKQGKRVLDPAAAKRVFRYGGDEPDHGSGYRSLDRQEHPSDGGRGVKVRDLIRRHAPEAEIVHAQRPGDGAMVQLVRTADVEKAMAKAWPKQARQKQRDRDKSTSERKRQERQKALVGATIALVLEKSRQAKDGPIWLLLARHLPDYLWSETVKLVLHRRGIECGSTYLSGGKKVLEAAAGDPVKARELVLELLMTRGRGALDDSGGALRAAAKLFRVTPEQAKRRANAEQAAAAERKKQEKAKPEKKAAAGPEDEPDEDES